MILSNFEFADSDTLNKIHSLARNGEALLVARGADVSKVSAMDAVLVLATTRTFSDVGDTPRETLLEWLKYGRPDFNWYGHEIHFAAVLVWNPERGEN